MTDLADYLSESVREEHIRQVRKKINELSIDVQQAQREVAHFRSNYGEGNTGDSLGTISG